MPRRWIAHLDMDAFYASVELLRYPELRGQPVVIGGRRDLGPRIAADGSRHYSRLRDYAGRGVITTATYEARALGVNSAMGMMKAAALAPDAVLLPVDFDEYRKYSRLFKAAVARIAPVIEDRGIDEIYMDLTQVPGVQPAADEDPFDSVTAVARAIKEAVRHDTGLSCSIGVTPNKLLSKLCSEFGKPDGLTVLTHADIPQRIWPLPARRVNGIGPKAAARLQALGLHTIGELAAADLQRLIDEFGANYAGWLHDAAHGRDDRHLVTHSEPKSISRETTFERDLHPRQNRQELGHIFTHLCEQLAADLVRKGYAARTIGVKLRYPDFRIVTRATSLSVATQDAAAIRRAAGQCLKQTPLDRPMRLLGVRADRLLKSSDMPAALDSATPARQQLPLPLTAADTDVTGN